MGEANISRLDCGGEEGGGGVKRSRFESLAGHLLWFWERHLTHRDPLHPGVTMGPGKLSRIPDKMLGGSIQCYGNKDIKLWQYELLMHA